MNDNTQKKRWLVIPIFVQTLFLMLLVAITSQAQGVDPSTGRAQISIPLGGINASDVSVPITLWHHGNSLRVAEGNGNAGMGFNLSVGGSISREVRGLPDDYNVSGDSRKGWLFNGNAQNIQTFTSTSDDNLVICTDELADRTFLQTLLYSKDSEPDLFFFQAPGISGKFVFGADGLPHLVGKQDIQISSSTNVNGISQFIIKTNRGMTYTFNALQILKRKAEKFKSHITPDFFLRDYYSYQAELSYVPSWELVSIQSTATGALASFMYEMMDEEVSASFRTRISSTSTQQADTIYYLRDTGMPQRLTQVNLLNYQISLTWMDGLISKISTTELTSASSQEFYFEYFSLHSASDAYPYLVKSFLQEIRQQNSCVSVPSYMFNYIAAYPSLPVEVPWHTNDKQDIYGFYNGVSGNKNIPTIYFYQSETGARRFRTTPIPGVSATQTLLGSNRNVDPVKVLFGALESIYYPTGGKTFFTYEPNSYFDTSTNEEIPGPGIRVKSVITSGGELLYGRGSSAVNTGSQAISRTYEYQQAGSTSSSGKLLYPAVFAFATGSDLIRSVTDLGEGPVVMYSRVKEKIESKGSTVYEFDLPAFYPTETEGSWSATRSKIARNTCSPSNYANGAYTFPFAPNTDYSYVRGTIKKRSDYTEGGILTRESQYNYGIAGTPINIKGLKYEPMGDEIHFGLYTIVTGQSNLLISQIGKEFSEQTPVEYTTATTAYQYNSKDMPFLVTRTNTDNSIAVEKIKYAFDFAITAPPVNDWGADAIKKLNASNRYGEVIEKIQLFTPRSGTQLVTGAQLVLFKDLNGKVLPHQIKRFPPGGAFTESVVGASQTFDPDSEYILSNTFEEYDVNGLPINQIDYQFNRTASHYSISQALPVASFYNVKAQQGVYEGFEFVTGRGLTILTGPGSVVSGWTGDKAMQLPATGVLTSGQVEKGESNYRISCWVKAAQATTLTFKCKNGITQISSKNLSYSPTTLSTWVYLEDVLDVSGSSPTFTIEISTTSAMVIDDVVALPKSGRLSLQTMKPFVGLTSTTDDRGNSSVVTYDGFGRELKTYDRKRNLINIKEYSFQRQIIPAVNLGFVTTSSNYFVSGQPITFDAIPNSCLTVTYQWKVDGVLQVSTSPSMIQSLTYGMHTVELIATNSTYGSKSYSENICVDFGPLDFNLAVTPSNTVHLCSVAGEANKTFRVVAMTGGCANPALSYVWSYTDINGANPILLTNANEYNTSVISFTSPNFSYIMKCEVTMHCGVAEPNCNYGGDRIASETIIVTYIDDQPCP